MRPVVLSNQIANGILLLGFCQSVSPKYLDFHT